MMKKRIIGFKAAIIAMMVVIGFWGCRGTTPPMHFYTLDAVDPNHAQGIESLQTQHLVIGIGPVSLPKYLDRSQIVIRKGSYQVEVDEFNRWAGTLEDDFLRVLSQNISTFTGSDNILFYPFRGDQPPDYTIKINVTAFEGTPGKSAILDCAWTLSSSRKDVKTIVKRSRISLDVQSSGFNGLVAAESKLVEMLCEEIARNIHASLSAAGHVSLIGNPLASTEFLSASRIESTLSGR